MASDSPFDAPERLTERLGERRHRGHPTLGDHLQPGLHRVLEAGRDLREEVGEHPSLAVDRGLSHQQRPQRGSKAEDVAAGRDHAAREHLGGHELRGADAHGARILLVDLRGDAEVHEHHTLLAENQVLRLHVAVHDLLLVHVLKRLTRLADVLDGVLDRKSLRPQFEQLPEILAPDQAHHQVLTRLGLEIVDHAHHARMTQLGEQPGLDLEAGRMPRVPEPLDRDIDSLLRVHGPVDRPHCPARDGGRDLVAIVQAQSDGQVAGEIDSAHTPRVPVGSREWLGWRSLRSSSSVIRWGTTWCRPTGRQPTRAGTRAGPRSASRPGRAHPLLHAHVHAGLRVDRQRARREGRARDSADRDPALDPGRRPAAAGLHRQVKGRFACDNAAVFGNVDQASTSSPCCWWRCWREAWVSRGGVQPLLTDSNVCPASPSSAASPDRPELHLLLAAANLELVHVDQVGGLLGQRRACGVGHEEHVWRALGHGLQPGRGVGGVADGGVGQAGARIRRCRTSPGPC